MVGHPLKIALITDTHAGARGESEAFNEYFFKFYEGVFFPYLKDHGIKQIIHLGDAVERQNYIAYRIAHQWRKRFWDRLRANQISTDVLVGNHDAPNNRYSNTPNAIEELYGDYPNIRVFSECCVQYYDGIPIALIPWINKGNYQMTMDFIDKVPASIAMGHLELSGFMMDQFSPAKFGMDKHIFDKFQIVMSGHYHHRSTDGKIWYLGNTYEIKWADYNDPRGFHIFDTHTRELEFIKNPHRMFHKITYDTGANILYYPEPEGSYEGKTIRVTCKRKDPEYGNFDEFLVALQDQKPLKIEVEDLSEMITNDTMVEAVQDTVQTIHTYIETSDTQLDKSRLKDMMGKIYQEATNG